MSWSMQTTHYFSCYNYYFTILTLLLASIFFVIIKMIVIIMHAYLANNNKNYALAIKYFYALLSLYNEFYIKRFISHH